MSFKITCAWLIKNVPWFVLHKAHCRNKQTDFLKKHYHRCARSLHNIPYSKSPLLYNTYLHQICAKPIALKLITHASRLNDLKQLTKWKIYSTKWQNFNKFPEKHIRSWSMNRQYNSISS